MKQNINIQAEKQNNQYSSRLLMEEQFYGYATVFQVKFDGQLPNKASLLY
jgi:hypothetical protein